MTLPSGPGGRYTPSGHATAVGALTDREASAAGGSGKSAEDPPIVQNPRPAQLQEHKELDATESPKTPGSTARPSETESRQGMDRRDMIKKAVVAGGVAWVAPTVLASSASAAEVLGCTPKCGPTNNGTFSGTVTVIECELQFPNLAFPQGTWHPATFAVGPITGAGSACGCGGTPQVTFAVGDTPFHVSNDDWDHGTGVDQHVAFVGRHPLHPDAPLPASRAILVTIRCSDRQGRGICRTCELYGRFTWTWTQAATTPAPNIAGKTVCEQAGDNNPPGMYPDPGHANGPFTINYTITNCGPIACCD